MTRKKLKVIAIFTLVFGFFLGSILYTSGTLKASDPSGVHVIVYQTDLMTGAGATPATVFTDAAGKSVDIVGNPDVFGKGSVAAGTYKRIKFRVNNIVSFTGPDPCGSVTAVTTSFPIDGNAGNTGQVDLYFATADDGGSSGWFANGTLGSPFLIQNAIAVQGGATTVVKLIFNTAGTLVCNGTTAELLPPTMNALNYVEQPAATGGYCSNLGDYWFFHYRLASYPTDSTGALITNPSLQQIMSSGQVVSGWGSMLLSAPSTTGAGTMSINMGSTYETRGMAEHRHNLYQYDPATGDQGYFDPASSVPATMIGAYLLTGNKMLVTFPDSMTIEGAMSTDCSTFVGVNPTQRDGSDLIVALKKTATQPSFPANAKLVSVSPQVNITYNANNIAQNFGYDSGWMALSTGTTTTSDGSTMEWKNRFEMYPDFSSTGTWSILPPQERVSMTTGFNFGTAFTIRSDGLITQMNGTTPEDFIALGANGNVIMAGEQSDESVRFPGSHRMAAGYMARANSSPTLNDIAGTWSIGTLETRLNGSNSWGTGVSYGDITITYSGGATATACGGLTYRDNLSGDIHPPDSSCSTIELHTECYAWDSTTNTGLPVGTAAASCIIPNPVGTPGTAGITMPVFYVRNSTGGIDAKFVLDYNKNTIVVWSPFDSDSTPCLSGQAGCNPDPLSKTSAGVGVKVQ